MPHNIKRLGPDDLVPFVEHITRHLGESGKDGVPVFDPNPDDRDFDAREYRRSLLARWQRPTSQPTWEVAWGIYEQSQIIAHLDLRASPLRATLHRATMGMGVESAFFRRGCGYALLNHAIRWARAEGLVWMDLRVFAHNNAAKSLYEKCGFYEVGRTKDAFRVNGASIDDIAMCLKL